MDYQKFQILIFFLVYYLFQGTLMSISSATISTLLFEKGVQFQTISLIFFMKYPQIFKFLYGSVIDSYYVKSMGKCKTHLLVGDVFLIVPLIISIFFFEEWVKNIVIIPILCWACFLSFAIAYQGVTIDAYAINIIKQEDQHYSGSCQAFGIFAGQFVGFTLFVTLTSSSVASDWYGEPQAKGFLSYQTFLLLILLVKIPFVLLLSFQMKESIVEEPGELVKVNPCQVVTSLKGWYYNYNLRIYGAILLFFRCWNTIWFSSYQLILISVGFTKEQIATYEGCALPFKLIAFFMLGKLTNYYHDMLLFFFSVCAGTVQNIIGILIFLLCRNSPISTISLILVGVQYLLGCLYLTHIVYQQSFGNKITYGQTEISSTFIAMGNTLFQLGRVGSETILVFAMGIAGFLPLQVMIDVCYLFYAAFFFFPYTRELCKLSYESFNLNIISNEFQELGQLQELKPQGQKKKEELQGLQEVLIKI